MKIEYTDISQDEFESKLRGFDDNLDELFESKILEKDHKENLKELNYGN